MGSLKPTILDPFCDERRPVKAIFSDIKEARQKIQKYVQVTQCTFSEPVSEEYGIRLYFKKEFQQSTASFKVRGGANAMLRLTEDQKRSGVISASAGNHAQALAHMGKRLRIPVTVVMPTNAPKVKVESCRKQGANVVIFGTDFAAAKQHAMELGLNNGLVYINGYDHPDVISGQGTVGLEIAEQVPDVDACVVPVGGGGLIAGVATALKTLKPDIKIYGVECECSTGFTQSLQVGAPITVLSDPTIADGLSVSRPGVNALETAKSLVDKMVTVKEESVHDAVFKLLVTEKATVEGAGAVGLAAIMEGLLPELKNKTVVVILSGGNIDPGTLLKVIERKVRVEAPIIMK
ncbi:L-threonine ammonia-lyase-like [Physella acuta]|uniref:L-threonine ammonia-lyase-like n=1 Tax=Physella acuta TaxID=109671 RepID=UPI0027DD01A8|nr:L-threonine ammonia-lyase-like [Physella acuta]